jgi:2-phospho-L-lactate/phosphoenolpyruvate guanylyltransferase
MTFAILPVKSFGHAKSRTALADERRAALAESMATAVLRALAEVRGLERILVVTREPRAAAAARAVGAAVVADPDEAGHSQAALLGVEAAVGAGARRVLLVPGDCPLLDATEVDALLATAGPGVTIVPDRHGTGTNALVLDPPAVMAPSFGPGSCARHAALARAAGVPVRIVEVPTLAFDVDTPDDLAALAAA